VLLQVSVLRQRPLRALATDIFNSITHIPAVQELRRRLEKGGVFSCDGISRAAQPFFAALVHGLYGSRPIVIVTEGLKTQESFHQDLETWSSLLREDQSSSKKLTTDIPGSNSNSRPLFYPAWEVLPHEAKLPHADVISERLETLTWLSIWREGQTVSANAPLVVTTATALMQRTYGPRAIVERTRTIHRGDQLDPLDLIEWLEDQGYEPEAKVTQKGEISLRGGILDVYPLTSPWPVRLEFFGNELESLRHFDLASQISREQIDLITVPPAGEIGILKGLVESESESHSSDTALATLLDHLPKNSILLFCAPESLAEQAEAYSQQIPANDPFFIAWEDLREEIRGRGMTVIELTESESPAAADWRPPHSSETGDDCDEERRPVEGAVATLTLSLPNLDAFRPLAERIPDPQIVEAQRREFFGQLHRWLRQGYRVHLFCNNEGERQRFGEIWSEYGLDASQKSEVRSQKTGISVHLGTLARGFVCDEAKVVVVTDAEVFGRYKVQRPRRLKSPHAIAARSALDIDFTELVEGDYVVHLQHGIGRYLGLQHMPVGRGQKMTRGASESAAGQECLVIEYASTDPEQPPPKLYVPVTEAHWVSKYVGAGKARPILNTLGGTRWAKTKAQAEQAVRDLASELLSIQAARESQARVRERFSLRRNARSNARHPGN